MAESEASGVRRDGAGEFRGDDGNFIRARHADDLHVAAGAENFRFRRAQHRVHITRIVSRGDNGKPAAARARFFSS